MALNDQQWLICHKTQPNIYIYIYKAEKEGVTFLKRVCLQSFEMYNINVTYIYKQYLHALMCYLI